MHDTVAELFPQQQLPQQQLTTTPRGSFFMHGGKLCSGTHLLVDLHSANNLASVEYIRKVLIDAVDAAHATLLHIHLHSFNGQGVSGVAVLSESHISIHTWPEQNYAALDLFMCGECDPNLAVPVLKQAFTPEVITIRELFRG